MIFRIHFVKSMLLRQRKGEGVDKYLSQLLGKWSKCSNLVVAQLLEREANI